MFISFEGIDGSGKTTQALRLVERLRAEGRTVVLVREPGGTDVGERIRTLLLDPASHISERCEVLLFSAARAQVVDEVIRPALSRGDVVVADRFYDSTTAYQGGGRGVLTQMEADALNGFATGALSPDLTLWVDVPPGVAAKRRGAIRDRIESAGETFYERVSEAYRALTACHADRIVRIDGERPADAIEDDIARVVERRM